MAKFAAKDSNKNITLSPHGTGKVVVGTGATDATVQSDGNHNLVLQTGNSTTGSITITDGADGDIAISPNGTGTVVVNTDLDVDNININGNTISSTNTDGNITLDPNGTGLVNINSATGASLAIDNLRLDGNAITSTNTDGNIDLTPDGTGEVNISKVDIDSGAIDGVTLGTNSAVTNAQIDNININANTISNTATNGTLILKPSGTGTIQLQDTDNNEILIANKTASAVNEITLTNAAAGNAPTISSSGDDTNIDLNINTKGTGSVVCGSNIVIPDAGKIGSASDSDAIAIASDGGLTFSGGIDNAGTISAGTLGSSVVFPAGGTGNPISVAILIDQKGTVDAGTATSGSYDPRDLNTLHDPDSFVTVESATQTISGHTSTYRFTLGAGMYSISAIVPAFRVAQHQSQLYDVTGTQVLKMGSSGYTDSGSGESNNYSFVQFVHSISANNTYEIRHKVSVSRSTTGLGVGGGFTNNIYTQVIIQKLK